MEIRPAPFGVAMQPRKHELRCWGRTERTCRECTLASTIRRWRTTWTQRALHGSSMLPQRVRSDLVGISGDPSHQVWAGLDKKPGFSRDESAGRYPERELGTSYVDCSSRGFFRPCRARSYSGGAGLGGKHHQCHWTKPVLGFNRNFHYLG